MIPTAAFERLVRRIYGTVARARLTVIDDSKGAQTAQVQLQVDDLRDGLPRLAEYGLTSNPPPGSDAAVLFINGERSNGVVIATGNQQFRLKGLASGEVALYDNLGQTVYLSKAGIKVTSRAGLPIVINSGADLTLNAPQGSVNVNAAAFRVNAPIFQATAQFTFTGAMTYEGLWSSNGYPMDERHRHSGGTISGDTGEVLPT